MNYDMIIIGSGAGGGTLARHLAPTGKKILILERGPFLPREKENWMADEVFVKNRYISKDTWLDKNDNPFQPQVHYYVGGATKLYGAALYRLRKEDFGELRHEGGVSPAWPISYDVMEPYYTMAERLYQVHGERGIDPTEPWASAPYPHPPLTHEPRIQELVDDLKKNGYKPFPAPAAVMLDEKNPPFSPCIRCSTCDGFPCLLLAKADAETSGVRPALSYPNVTLLTEAMALRIKTNAQGKEATEVEVLIHGEKTTFQGDIIVVSAGAANTAKLLLSSRNANHPDGLANGSGMVGRNYMFHASQGVLALSLKPNPTKFQKTMAINDFYFGSSDYPFPMGNIQMLGKSMAPMFRGEKPLETALVPGMLLEEIASHSVDFWLTTEDLPDMENRVTLDKEGRIRLSYTENNQKSKKMLFEKLKNMLGVLGMKKETLIPRAAYLKSDIPLAGVAHQAGTCRFGLDKKSSVLDVHCKAHELDNLYVVDTSFFPSIGAVNPSLTAIANALRVGDHIKERWDG